MQTVPTLNPSIPFKPADKPTREVVARLVSLTDGRSKAPKGVIESLICGILAHRGLPSFKISKAGMTDHQKAAWNQIHRHLMGDLLVGVTGANTFKVKDTLPDTLVVSDMPATLPFRVAGQYAKFTTPESIHCAEAVGTVNGLPAVKVHMPDVALTLQYVLDNRKLPARINRLDPLDDISAALYFAKDFRAEVQRALLQSKYMAVLIHDGDVEGMTFVATAPHAGKFSKDIESLTKNWLNGFKIDLVTFYSTLEDRKTGQCAVQTGEPTLQLLRGMSGLPQKYDSNATA